MQFHIKSSPSISKLQEILDTFTIKELGTTWTQSGHFYQSFLGELKKKPTPAKSPAKSPAKPRRKKNVSEVSK